MAVVTQNADNVAWTGDSDDLSEGSTKLLMTSAERTKLDAIDVVFTEQDVSGAKTALMYATWNTSDVTATLNVIAAPGSSSFPNKIGAQTKPAGTDVATGWTDDTGYSSGAASVATISGGYDMVVNQVAGTICGGGHNFIQYHVDGHSIIGGGSYNWIEGGRGGIFSGRQGYIDAATSFGTICGGDNNSLLGANYGAILTGQRNEVNALFGAMISGQDNTVGSSGLYATVINGSSNTLNANYSTVINGSNNNLTGGRACTIGNDNVVSGDFATAFGANITATADYTFSSGRYVHADIVGAAVFSGRRNQIDGDCQSMVITLGGTTTGTELLGLSPTGQTNAIAPDDSIFSGEVHIHGTEEGGAGDGNVCAYRIPFVVKRIGTTSTTILGGAQIDVEQLVDEIGVPSKPFFDLHSAGNLRVRAYGKSATTINWTATIVSSRSLKQ